MLAPTQSPYIVASENCLLYPQNALITNVQLPYVRFGPYPDSSTFHDCNNQVMPEQSHHVPGNNLAISPYQYYQEPNFVMVSPSFSYPQLAPIMPQNIYPNQLVPYVYQNNGTTSNYNSNSVCTLGNLPGNYELAPAKQDKWARKWTGELHETKNVTDYQCRFEIGTHSFKLVVDDLKRLYRSNIQIIDDIPAHNNINTVLIAYFKSDHFEGASKHFHNGNFVHPEKKYMLRVSIKAFSLPEGLQTGRNFKFNRAHNYPEWQLYVEGIDRMFSASDLFKIYDDMYGSVVWVRVFTDKNGFPHKSALVVFRKSDSYNKALHESPIMVKTSSLKCFLRNKVYQQRNRVSPRLALIENGNEQNNMPAQSHGQVYGVYRDNGNATNYHKQRASPNSSLTPGAKMKRFLTESERKDKHRMLKLREDANASRGGNITRYTRVKQEYVVFNKLKYFNYLSD